MSTPRSSLTSPEPGAGPSTAPASGHRDKDAEKRKSFTPEKAERGEEEVAALSEMMCSLVTNNRGETRYLGTCCCYPGRPP